MSTMAEDTLQSLAQRAVRGDQGAFADLYGLTARRVYGLCRHMLASREAAARPRGRFDPLAKWRRPTDGQLTAPTPPKETAK